MANPMSAKRAKRSGRPEGVPRARGSERSSGEAAPDSAEVRARAESNELRRTVDWQNPRVVQILDAAARAFGKSGFAQTTIQDIAQEAGMTKAMVHYYFESKQALIQELQAFVYERHFRKVEQRIAENGPNSATGRANEALLEVYEIIKDKHFFRLQLELLGECGRDPALMKRMAVLLKRSRDLVSISIENVMGERKLGIPIEVVSTLISATVHGLRVFETIEGDNAPTKDAYQLFVILLMLGMERNRQD